MLRWALQSPPDDVDFHHMSELLSELMDKRALRRWSRAAEKAETLDTLSLMKLRDRARALNKRVDRVLDVAESKLQLPLSGHTAVRRPMHSDWAWRPELWSVPINPPGISAVASKEPFGREARVFHDCRHCEITLRQVRNTTPEDVAPFGVRIDVFRFAGTFLSLVVDLPKSATEGLSRSHVVRLEIRLQTESAIEVFGRLNVKHGPNVEQIVREFDQASAEAIVEFDLAASELNERRVDRGWVDLIFEAPHMNQISLADVTLSRRPRAEV